MVSMNQCATPPPPPRTTNNVSGGTTVSLLHTKYFPPGFGGHRHTHNAFMPQPPAKTSGALLGMRRSLKFLPFLWVL